MSTKHIVIIQGGMSETSSTALLEQRYRKAIAQRFDTTETTITTISIRNLAHDIADMHLTGVPSQALEAALDTVADATGIIALTPTYAGSYGGLFKAFADVIGNDRIAGTPVLLGATGGSSRHSMMLEMAMRPLFAAMRALTLPVAVFASSDDAHGTVLASRVDLAVAQLRHSLDHGKLPTIADHQFAPTAASSNPPALPAHLAQIAVVEEEVGIATPTNDFGVGGYTTGKGSTVKLLRSDGTKGTLRPDLEDFVPMDDLLK
ncbi:CE1759 family FMN reductase [Corynebacterium choanae]|uniref:FMN reductase (NADPH) n=1 Tax=Corynebacterium choanae TaxID=1862358 RepID=A0A3G6J4D5_9CORY|nr:CE1759 family FMN reductase [Corynebacterium choanae]AZA12951.1 FMN reductase (NADPH) [Corynebacterium choanae]